MTKFLRALLAPVAALAIASPAAAQFDQNATHSQDHINIADAAGTHINPITFLDGVGGPVTYDGFCIDFANFVSKTQPIAVNLTRFDASAAAFNQYTRFGVNVNGITLSSYLKAAWLTRFLDPSLGLSASQLTDVQFAIWHQFTLGPSPHRPGESVYTGLLLSDGGWANINQKYWFVVSDVSLLPTTSTRSGHPLVGGNQEFIVFVAPEPSAIVLLGTGMLGIVGLAARRRKR